MNQSSNQQTGNNGGQSGSKNDVTTTTDAAASALKDGIVAGARALSTDVTHVAADVAKEAKKAADSKLDAGKDFAAEQFGAVAGALRETSRQLRQSESGLTEYVEKAARSVDGVSTYLQTRTLSQLISDVEGYARREPAVFLGGAFFVGLLGGRFLKSAAPAPVRSNGSGSGSPTGVSQRPQAPDFKSTGASRDGGSSKPSAPLMTMASKGDDGGRKDNGGSDKDGSKTSGNDTRGTSSTSSSSPKGEGRGGVG